MSLNKKGIGWETIGKWVFALLVIAILWVLFIDLGDFLYGTGNKAACKNWVYRNSVTALKEFVGDKENSPCVTTEEIIKTTNQNEIYEQVARNMYECWDQYGQGETDFYSDIDWGPRNLYCRVCSEIKFSDDVKQKIKEIDVDEFEIYLNDHNPPNSKMTYADFFIKAENSKIDFGEGKIPLDQNLYTMFTAYKVGDYSAGGLFNKLVTAPLSVMIGGSLIPGAGKAVKGMGGLVKFKTPGIPGPYSGTGTASTITKGGGWIGLAIVYVGVAGMSFLNDGSVLLPSIILLSADSPKISECDAEIYYNPEKKPFELTKK